MPAMKKVRAERNGSVAGIQGKGQEVLPLAGALLGARRLGATAEEKY